MSTHAIGDWPQGLRAPTGGGPQPVASRPPAARCRRGTAISSPRSTQAIPLSAIPASATGREDGRVRPRREPKAVDAGDRQRASRRPGRSRSRATATPSRSATTPNHASASQKARPTQKPTRPKSPAKGRSRPSDEQDPRDVAGVRRHQRDRPGKREPHARRRHGVRTSARAIAIAPAQNRTSRRGFQRGRDLHEERGKEPEPAEHADDAEQRGWPWTGKSRLGRGSWRGPFHAVGRRDACPAAGRPSRDPPRRRRQSVSRLTIARRAHGVACVGHPGDGV